jgi:2-hydroxychromene-2-carboxylate isomerase
MVKTLEFIFDFGSPNAYLAYKALPDILARTGANLVITPCLLGGIFKATGNQSPIHAYANIPAKLAYQHLEIKRFVARHNLTKFRMNPHFPINTLLIMRALTAAQTQGQTTAFIDAIFPGMWEDGLRMDDPVVVADVLTKSGLNAATLLTATQDAAVKQQLITNTESAVARGAFGIPSFFVGSDLYFGKDKLPDVEAALR